MAAIDEESDVNTMGIRGIPVKCECGRDCLIKTSRSKENPGRPFFRCPTFRDDHLFKWVEEAVYEELEDALLKIGSSESEICKTKMDIEGIRNVNSELMEEVSKAKKELKRLNLVMKVGFWILCFFIIICILMILFGKSKGMYLSSY